jgi:tetratricopeptide (TPR) repeat protein
MTIGAVATKVNPAGKRVGTSVFPRPGGAIAKKLIAVAAVTAILSVASATAHCQKTPPGKKGVEPAEWAGENAGWLYNRASTFVAQGRCEDAIPILEELVNKFPQLAGAKEMLSDCYLRAGRAQDAVPFLERCRAEDPENFVYARNLGLAYLDLGQKDRAIAAWRGALKDDERFSNLYGTVARVEQEAGLYDEAIETLREGTKFKPQQEYYTREIIRLERLLGRDEAAFREALSLFGRREEAFELELRTVADVFEGSKHPERLIAIADSVAAARGARERAFQTLKMVLLIEAGRYEEVRAVLFGAHAVPLPERELYSLLNQMAQRAEQRNDERFSSLYADAMGLFLDRYPSSPLAPGVMLMAAANKLSAARREHPVEGGGRESGIQSPRRGAQIEAIRARLLEEALGLADRARQHRAGAAFLERAAIFRARLLFEDLHEPDEALAELGSVRAWSEKRAAEACELRLRILLASSDVQAASRELARLAADPDTVRAALGAYGVGKLDFLEGKFKESIKTLSELAERHPSSTWANDALELAIEIKGAIPEGTGALDLYRSSVRASGRGKYAEAIDSLAALEARFPLSSLVPRAIFMKGTLEAASGGPPDQARSDFTRLAEKYPLHDLAPRALEELGALAERESPDRAIEQYGALMERYPDYPFMERVRERYIALGKSAPAEQLKAPREQQKEDRR